MKITQEWIDRFNAKWKLDEATKCWEWTGAHMPKGYGQIKIPGTRKQIYAHRLSFLIHRGQIPPTKCVLHHCDNPKCVNPEHLFVGTQLTNAIDMAQKMRHVYGERQPNAKLTDDQVREIHKLITLGVTQKRVAEMFNVHPMHISRIRRGKEWKHIFIERL